MTQRILKTLSGNDVGATGGHQAGILVPKAPEILTFFPTLHSETKNPRVALIVREKVDGTRWEFNFIHYNNRRFGGTRNEYRLTGMTAYLRAIGARSGDEIAFEKDDNGSIHMEHVRSATNSPDLNERGALILSGGWKYIDY